MCIGSAAQFCLLDTPSMPCKRWNVSLCEVTKEDLCVCVILLGTTRPHMSNAELVQYATASLQQYRTYIYCCPSQFSGAPDDDVMRIE